MIQGQRCSDPALDSCGIPCSFTVTSIDVHVIEQEDVLYAYLTNGRSDCPKKSRVKPFVAAFNPQANGLGQSQVFTKAMYIKVKLLEG